MEIVNHNDIECLITKDSIFKQIQKNYGNPPSWARPEGFISLSQMILEQQVSLASARAHFDKLNAYLSAFTPTELIKLSDEEIRSCQISRQKTKYLRALAEAVLSRELVFDELQQMPAEEVRKKLTAIKGIGNWTTDVYLMFCLQAKDIFPTGDIALVNTVKEFFGEMDTEEIVKIGERWQPLRSLATYFLWHHYLCKRGRS